MALIKKYRHPKYYKDLEERRKKLSEIKVIDLPDEIWVDILNYLGYYKISNFFRIKSVCRLATKKNGSTVMKPEQLLAPHINSDGYLSVTKDGKSLRMAYNKITQGMADEIRGSSLSQRQLCDKYGISKGLVYNIKNNISYNGLN